jgi:TolB-like protein
LFTDVITDGLRVSAFLSSVISPSVAISVRKTKKSFADGFTDGICAQKKKDSRLKYTDGFLFRR